MLLSTVFIRSGQFRANSAGFVWVFLCLSPENFQNDLFGDCPNLQPQTDQKTIATEQSLSPILTTSPHPWGPVPFTCLDIFPLCPHRWPMLGQPEPRLTHFPGGRHTVGAQKKNPSENHKQVAERNQSETLEELVCF